MSSALTGIVDTRFADPSVTAEVSRLSDTSGKPPKNVSYPSAKGDLEPFSKRQKTNSDAHSEQKTSYMETLLNRADTLVETSVNPATVSAYASVFSSLSAKVEEQFQLQQPEAEFKVFPACTEEKIKVIFSAITLDKAVSAAYWDNNVNKIKYSAVRSFRAALRFEHNLKNIPTPLNNPWHRTN